MGPDVDVAFAEGFTDTEGVKGGGAGGGGGGGGGGGLRGKGVKTRGSDKKWF